MNQDRFKFRRPNFQNGKFIGFDYYELNQGLVINEEHCEMTDSYKENPTMGAHGHIVGQDEQCTGLKDKNGTLGYHNDRYINEFGVECVIEWDKDKLVGKNETGIIYNIASWFDKCEIIGSIHEKESK